MGKDELDFEHCQICYEVTGKSGRGDDSIYCELEAQFDDLECGDEVGPLCGECFDAFRQLCLIDE